MEKEVKACPYCGEEILATAIKCKHCGEFLDGRKVEENITTSVIPYSRKIVIKCPSCGYEGQPKKDTPGSILIELVLWLCFLIPGIVYSFRRMGATGTCKCPKCGNSMLSIKQQN